MNTFQVIIISVQKMKEKKRKKEKEGEKESMRKSMRQIQFSLTTCEKEMKGTIIVEASLYGRLFSLIPSFFLFPSFLKNFDDS